MSSINTGRGFPLVFGNNNKVLFNDKVKYTPDDITKKFTDKINEYEKKGLCDICLEENVILIPFDCNHMVCAYNCYPQYIYTKKCPTCQSDI